MSRRFNVVGLSIALMLLLTACGVTSGLATGTPIAATAVTPVATPTATPSPARCTAPGSPVAGGGVSPQFDLYGIAAISPSEAWAVGTDGTHGVILHYCDSTWTHVHVTGTVNGVLTSVAMISPDEGWAVGGTRGAGGQDVILHYVNGAWTIANTPTALSQRKGEPVTTRAKDIPGVPLAGQGEPALLSISMASATEGWAMGLRSMFHYHDGTWASVAYPVLPRGSPSPMPVMNSVAMLSPIEGWAVGSPNGYTNGVGNNGVVLHYLNGSWLLVASAATPGGLLSVAMVTPAEGWAVGYFGAILHYVDGHWTAAASPTTSELDDVAMVSASEGWAVGNGTILHYAHGQWTQAAAVSASLLGVAMGSPSLGWAVGSQGTVLRYDGTTWH